MKTMISSLAAAALLSLAACAKPDDAATNVTVEEPAGKAEALGNDTSFASDNVILPEENAADTDAANLTSGADNAGNLQ